MIFESENISKKRIISFAIFPNNKLVSSVKHDSSLEKSSQPYIKVSLLTIRNVANESLA